MRDRDLPSMIGRHATWACLAFAAAGCLSGCRLHGQFPPQPVRVVGTSYNPGVALQQVPPPGTGPDWTGLDAAGDGTISTSGDAEVPVPALDPLQGRLLAKQMARQAARRNLAGKVEATELQPGLTIGEIIRHDAGKRQRLEDALRRARQTGVIKGDGGRYTVFLAIDRGRLIRAVTGAESADGGTSFSVLEGSPAALRERGRREALENARSQALEYLRGRKVGRRENLGQRMLRDDELDRAIRRMVQDLPAVKTSFRDDGSCEVQVELDLAKVQRLTAPRRFRLSWPVRLPWSK